MTTSHMTTFHSDLAETPRRPDGGGRDPSNLRVFISTRESRCDECHDDLGSRALIFLAGDRGALCLTCADLDHLVFLGPGDAALTRRARKHSTLTAVVLKWSRARKRYAPRTARGGRRARACRGRVPERRRGTSQAPRP